jgi:uncharacterized OB-fold protein
VTVQLSDGPRVVGRLVDAQGEVPVGMNVAAVCESWTNDRFTLAFASTTGMNQ